MFYRYFSFGYIGPDAKTTSASQTQLSQTRTYHTKWKIRYTLADTHALGNCNPVLSVVRQLRIKSKRYGMELVAFIMHNLAWQLNTGVILVDVDTLHTMPLPMLRN